MSVAIFLLSSAAAPPVVLACAVGFLAYLAWRAGVRAVERRLDALAGSE